MMTPPKPSPPDEVGGAYCGTWLVEMVTRPDAGAVHEYQTELPPGLSRWSGSPDSLVAPAFEAGVETWVPESLMRFTKSSLAGAGVKCRLKMNFPPSKLLVVKTGTHSR